MIFLLAALQLSSLLARAESDSVMVIIRPEKALIQVNEPAPAARWNTFLTALTGRSSGDVLLENQSNGFKLDCGRSQAGVSCVVRVYPGEDSRTEPKRVRARIKTAELGLLPSGELAEATFLGSNGDSFTVHLANGLLDLVGTKR